MAPLDRLAVVGRHEPDVPRMPRTLDFRNASCMANVNHWIRIPPDLRSSPRTLHVGLRALRMLRSTPQRGRTEPKPFDKTSTGRDLGLSRPEAAESPRCAIKDLRACPRHTRNQRGRVHAGCKRYCSPAPQKVCRTGNNPPSPKYPAVLDIFTPKRAIKKPAPD